MPNTAWNLRVAVTVPGAGGGVVVGAAVVVVVVAGVVVVVVAPPVDPLGGGGYGDWAGVLDAWASVTPTPRP
ncbi:MAG TPA: hypothetical protein VGR90_11140, partial [Acidimicrobiales bacterium]|nr:hypothetical protein [Acidimicrobiales bacterium]